MGEIRTLDKADALMVERIEIGEAKDVHGSPVEVLIFHVEGEAPLVTCLDEPLARQLSSMLAKSVDRTFGVANRN